MVGGTDYAQSQFNRAIVSTRQPGSAFKIFVYATAMEALDLTPESVVSGATQCIGNWCPMNYSRNSVGNISLISAFGQSINTVPVNLSIKTGRDPIAALSHRMGLRADFPVTRSLALGPASVSVIDMTSAYAVLANDGLKTPAFGFTRIATLSGDVVWEYDVDATRERILSERTVGYMNQMMRYVVTNGTGKRADIPGVPAVGKTGTTSSYKDAWFCGFTGNFVAAVWFGNDDYKSTENLTGGTLPTIAWQKFMAYAHTNIDINPVMGVDFDFGTPVIVADAAADATALPVAVRPPTLTREAGLKLLEMAERLQRTLEGVAPGTGQVAIVPDAALSQGT